MCKTGELISSLQTIQIPVQKSWICRRFLFQKSCVKYEIHLDKQLLGDVRRPKTPTNLANISEKNRILIALSESFSSFSFSRRV